ncbi:MAG TPA: hypothetical protein VE987_21820 [Polyangiaceae bacterium]|nr:hypothetical protein [Polyangiaceae bacterium]
MRRAIALLLLASTTACRRATSAAAVDASPARAAGREADGSVVGPPRCRPADRPIVLDAAALEELEIGGAARDPGGGTVVAAAHRGASGRTAAVVLVGSDASGAARVVDLGPTLGDAPLPRLFSCGSRLLAAAFDPSPAAGPSRSSPERSLALWALQSPPRRAYAPIRQRRDESLAFDAACSRGAAAETPVIVWDESVAAPGAAPRGVIRLAASGPNGLAWGPRDVSPSDSDADSPRILPAGPGFIVLWLAHRPDASIAADAAGTGFETPGEIRTNGWVEMLAIDESGNAAGPVRRLTPTSGHVSVYDAAIRLDRPDTREGDLVVVALDDGEAADGAGGALLRVHARGAVVDPPVALVTGDLGRGGPVLVEGAVSPWLTWVGSGEQLRLTALDATGAPLAPPSGEDALDDAQPLLELAPGRMLVATPRDAEGKLRVFACER